MTLRLSLLLLLLAALVQSGAAWGAVDSLNGITGTGAANAGIEGTMRMTRATMPTGASKQVDSARAIVLNTYLSNGSGYNKVVIYEIDSSYIGQSDSANRSYTSGGTAMQSWTFSDPKPTLVGDSSYIFGTWSAPVAGNVVNQRIIASGASNEYWTQIATWASTPPDPITPTRQTTTGYVQVALYYSDIPASIQAPKRRRKIIMETGWKDMEQRFLWPQCAGGFAGDMSDDIQK